VSAPPDVQGLSCQELVELVTDYLENALRSEERDRFEQHLDECGNCQQYLAQMRTTIELTGELTPESLSPEAERELLAAFRNWRTVRE
jgi:predicted anti-sigma-YlaC factor YlaD